MISHGAAWAIGIASFFGGFVFAICCYGSVMRDRIKAGVFDYDGVGYRITRVSDE